MGCARAVWLIRNGCKAIKKGEMGQFCCEGTVIMKRDRSLQPICQTQNCMEPGGSGITAKDFAVHCRTGLGRGAGGLGTGIALKVGLAVDLPPESVRIHGRDEHLARIRHQR
eukprot:EG_transcript_28081